MTQADFLSQPWKNPVINEARECALKILQPTDSQLEEGLEIHREATVVESYGFAAFMDADHTRYDEAVKAMADPDELVRIDLESRMTRMTTDPEQGELFREAWKAAGVTCVLRQSGEEGNNPVQMLERLSYNTLVTDRMRDFMIRATIPEDIEQAKREDKHCFYHMTNGVPLPGDFRSEIAELRLIGHFFGLGVRMMHLTYNRRNAIGEGCAESNDGGLSMFGEAVVREMNRVGVIVDVAHSSTKTALDSVRVSSKPVVVSHAACRALHDHCRGKPDEVIKAMADSGGYMSICCLPKFLGRTGDIQAFLDHIDHAVKLVGADHVAIGTDRGMPMPGTGWGTRPTRGERFEHYWPANASPDTKDWETPEMSLSTAWCNYPLFSVGLLQRGYKADDIKKILGGNVLRVAREVLR